MTAHATDQADSDAARARAALDAIDDALAALEHQLANPPESPPSIRLPGPRPPWPGDPS
jgi:hypothetical protein